jgi:hypothetical protein
VDVGHQARMVTGSAKPRRRQAAGEMAKALPATHVFQEHLVLVGAAARLWSAPR